MISDCVVSWFGTHISDLSVHFHQLVNVELWRFYNLRLADVDTLYWEDAPRRLFDFTANGLWHKLLDELLEIARSSFTGHDFEHFLPDLPDLGGLSIRCLADLIRPSLGESNGEQSNNVAVCGLDIHMGFNERLPLANKRAQFVRGKVHAVEVC